MASSLVDLSKQKFASNVIEKCLNLNLADFKESLIQTISQDEVLTELICDKYANYVIQRCLSAASEEQMAKILKIIVENANTIRNDIFGQKIYTKLAKSYTFLISDSSPLTATSNNGNLSGDEREVSKASSASNTANSRSENSYSNTNSNANNNNNGGKKSKNNNNHGDYNNHNSRKNQNQRNYKNYNNSNHQHNHNGQNYNNHNHYQRNQNRHGANNNSNSNSNGGGQQNVNSTSSANYDYNGMYNGYMSSDIMTTPNIANAFIQTNNFYIPQTQIFTNRIFNQYYNFQYGGYPAKFWKESCVRKTLKEDCFLSSRDKESLSIFIDLF